MNKTELIASMAEKSQLSKKDAEKANRRLKIDPIAGLQSPVFV